MKLLDRYAANAYIHVVPKKKLTHDEVVAMLKKRQGDLSLRRFAKELRITAPHLSDIYRGNRHVGPKILEQFGLEKVVESTIYYESVA